MMRVLVDGSKSLIPLFHLDHDYPPSEGVPSEVQLHSHLHHPLRERVVDYAGAGAPNSNDGSCAQSKIRVVSRVEHLQPKLHPHLLPDGEGSVYAQIQREKLWAHYREGSGIAESTR